MDIGIFIRGLILGFAIAAAVGPISLLTIRRTITDGPRIGLASGLGVATADATYGAVAAFGLTAVSDVLVAQARPLGLLGGAFLVYLGARTMLSPCPRAEEPARASSRGLASAYLSILGLTLANPMTILSFAAIFVGLGLIRGDTATAALLVAGVFLGSLGWWLVLVSAVAALRSRITPPILRWVTIASGVLIVTFGVLAIAGALRGQS